MNGLENTFSTLTASLAGQTGVLIVAIPLVMAPIVALLRRPVTVATMIVTVGVICTALAMALVGASATSALDYALGGWQPPVGIGFHIDTINALVALIVSAAFLLAALFATCCNPEPSIRASHPGAAGLLCLSGLLGVTLTGDLFNMFVFLEISSLSAYALIAAGGQRDIRALRAAFDYLVMGSIGAGFFVIGVGFLYGVTGTLNMADMASRLGALGDNRAATAGLAFIIAGLGLKAAMFPVHQWLPSSYAYALPAVTVFLSASATKVALYALVRVLFDVAGHDTTAIHVTLVWVVAPLAAIGAVVCSVKALLEPDIRRVFAWSSVAQAGYMMLAVAVGSVVALAAAFFHMMAHALMKSALFMAIGPVSAERHVTLTTNSLAGAARSAPWTITMLAICGLSLAGLPPTLGFVSKWLFLEAFVLAKWYWAAGIMAVSGLISFAYVGKILIPACMGSPNPETPTVKENTPAALILLTIMALAHIGFGLYSTPLQALAAQAAHAIMPPTCITVTPPESEIAIQTGQSTSSSQNCVAVHARGQSAQ